jgi:multiple sugar transport system substrate-binding protein
LKVLHNAGVAPEIYQVYAAWGVTYVKQGLFDKPPEYLLEDIKKNYVSTKGVTIDGEIWGIPTEINVYVLLYNKELLKEAGFTSPPKTWDELVKIAKKTTKKDAKGNIVQYGIAFLKRDEGQVVDTYLSWLFSNGGQFIDVENKKSVFNSPEGVEALQQISDLFKDGTTDINGNFWKFDSNTVAMVISAPWTKNNFKKAFGADFEKKIGTAPIPYMKKSASLQYSWFMGVMKEAKNKEEAWKFLEWFTTDVQPETKTTRFGDLLANTIGAIPSRNIDLENHDPVLNDFFTNTFVKELKNGVAEPNIPEVSKMKTILMDEIEATWVGDKNPQQALDDAAKKIDLLIK